MNNGSQNRKKLKKKSKNSPHRAWVCSAVFIFTMISLAQPTLQRRIRFWRPRCSWWCRWWCRPSCPGGQYWSRGKCCPYGQYNSRGVCCQKWSHYNSGGLCCRCGFEFNSSGKCCRWGTKNSNGLCCPSHQYNSNNLCCDQDSYNAGSNTCCKKGLNLSNGLCCLPGTVRMGSICCPQTHTNVGGKCVAPPPDPIIGLPKCGTNCEACSQQGMNPCTQCSPLIEKLELRNGQCVCEDGFTYNEDKTKCVPCNSACSSCKDTSTTRCLKCNVGWYIKEIKNGDGSGTVECLDCQQNQDDERCSSNIVSPSGSVSVEDYRTPNLASWTVASETSMKKFESFRHQTRKTYRNYIILVFEKTVMEIIKAMMKIGAGFHINEAYDIVLSSGSKLDKDFELRSLPLDLNKLKIYFNFKNGVKLENSTINVVLKTKNQNYLVEGVQEIWKRQAKASTKPKSRILENHNRFISSHSNEQKEFPLLLLKQVTIINTIIVRTSAQKEREEAMESTGFKLGSLIGFAFGYMTLCFLLSFFFKNSFLRIKTFNTLVYFQFIPKLCLIDLELNPSLLSLTDSLFRIESFQIVNFIEEALIRGSVTGRFKDYRIPVILINSIPMSLFLITFCLVLFKLSDALKKHNPLKSHLERGAAFMTASRFIDVVFYSLFSLTSGKNHIFKLIPLVALILTAYSVKRAYATIWSNCYKGYLYDNQKSSTKKNLILISFMAEPTKLFIFTSLIALLRRHSLVLIAILIGGQSLSVVASLLYNWCLEKQIRFSKSTRIIRELSLCLILSLFRLNHSQVLDWSSDDLYDITLAVAFLLSVNLICSLVFSEVEDYIISLRWVGREWQRICSRKGLRRVHNRKNLSRKKISKDNQKSTSRQHIIPQNKRPIQVD